MTTPPQNTWSDDLWSDVDAIYAGIIAHPFVTGLTDGSLDPEAFAQYVAQDVH